MLVPSTVPPLSLQLPQARRPAPPSIRGRSGTAIQQPRVPLAATQTGWPLGTDSVTNHWTKPTNGNPSPCFGFVSDLPAQSRGRLLSGVGRTGFMDTLPTLSDPRRLCLHVPSRKSSRLRLTRAKSEHPNKAKKTETRTSHKERNYVTQIPVQVADRPRSPDRDTQRGMGTSVCMELEPQTMTTKNFPRPERGPYLDTGYS